MATFSKKPETRTQAEKQRDLLRAYTNTNVQRTGNRPLQVTRSSTFAQSVAPRPVYAQPQMQRVVQRVDAAPQVQARPRKKGKNIKAFISLIFYALLFFAFVATVFSLYSWWNASQNPAASAKKTNDEIVKNIGASVALPSGTPRFAVVTNLEQAQSSSPIFFKDAEIGDVLVVYDMRNVGTQVYLYSTRMKKLLNMTVTQEK